ncbi:MAG: DNA polymerase III subunit delta' [Aquincola sp.]|nr:DNA polymerase III subunit delta' [Aquincola sp.]
MQPAHALLLHAAGALGQFDLALALAQGWLCESPVHGRACGACAACRLFGQHSHPDLKVLLPEALREPLGWAVPATDDGDEGTSKSKAKPSREIRIDEVRAAIEWGQRTMSRGRAKVLLIHPAEAMNTSAANALLKTLEEPPGALRLVLTAHDPDMLLPTVRSRCQRIHIAMPTSLEALAWLNDQGVDEPQVLLSASGGLPQAAFALHAEGIDAAAWRSVPAAARRGGSTTLVGWPVPRLVDALHRLCHDLMATMAGGAPTFFEPGLLAPLVQPRGPTMDALAQLDSELRRASRQQDHPWHAGLRAEALLSRVAVLWQTPRDVPVGQGRPLDTLPGR